MDLLPFTGLAGSGLLAPGREWKTSRKPQLLAGYEDAIGLLAAW